MTTAAFACAPASWARATARPVVAALRFALASYGVPARILTDSGKAFTRFGSGPGPVLLDPLCTANGIRHPHTAPYSPTTTGKVERFHKTLRKEFFGPNDYRFATVEEAQCALDGWVREYNEDRPHQSIRDRPPGQRFRLAGTRRAPPPAHRAAGGRRTGRADVHGEQGLLLLAVCQWPS